MNKPHKPLISVIMPTYNSAEYLNESINSVLNQTYPHFELIIIDDGSSDNTREVVSGFKEERIKYRYQENQGPCIARNHGIENASGKYISFLDADDYYYPDKLKLQLSVLENNPGIGLVAGSFVRVNEEGQAVRQKQYFPNKCVLIENLIKGNPFIPSSTLIRRQFVHNVNGFDPKLKRGEDWDLHIRLALTGCTMILMKEIVCAYRFRSNAVTKTTEDYCTSMIDVVTKTFGDSGLPIRLKHRKPKALAQVYLRLSSRCFATDNMSLGQKYLAKALESDPGIRKNNYYQVGESLIFWLKQMQCPHEFNQLNKIMQNLPPEAQGMRKHSILFIRRLLRQHMIFYLKKNRYLSVIFRLKSFLQ